MTKTMTTAELATEIGTTPRELRKFLRSQDAGVGKGSRYALPGTAAAVKKFAKQYAEWDAARIAAKQAKSQESPVEDNSDDEVESDNSLDELEGPTDDELTD